MTISAGTRLGPYEILSAIGAGGMGEVYKASDTRLHRTVAIKVLPQHVSGDAEVKKRFEREAQAVAALNHPHICVLHDVGRHDDTDYIVLEYLEGETLGARLEKGPIPLDQALRYALQVADALDKAHARGVVHRDLKPGNIMLTKTGVKLLDFGLAKLREEGPFSAANQSAAPTMDAALTGEGTILGTLQYMAPEQLEGKEADARSDIFALGTLIYEMLTGKKAFEGKSQASLIAAILEREPQPLAELQPITPPALDHVVRGCMAKDPSDRWQTAHDIVKQLQWIASTPHTTNLAAEARTTTRRSSIWIAATVFFVLTTAAISLVYLRNIRSVPSAQPMRFTVTMPENVRLASMLTVVGASASNRAISPDGRRLVFSGVDEMTGKMMLYLRHVDSVEARALPGTEGAAIPFWSPGSDAIAFFAEGKLRRVSADGGEPIIICDAPAAVEGLFGGGTWNRDDVIVARLDLRGGLHKVSARGGTPTPVTTLSSGEAGDMFPQFLPDGNHFLYFSRGSALENNAIYAGSLDSRDRKLVFKGINAMAVYAHPNHLLFLRDGALMIQEFNTSRLELTGEPVRLVDHISASPLTFSNGGFGVGAFSASENGVIVYRSTSRSTPDRFLWIGRDGKEIGPVLPPGYYRDPAVSPDGSRLAFARKESATGPFNIYILELATGKETRFTVSDGDDQGPAWSHDGNSVMFSSSRKQGSGFYRKNANGAGAEELVYSMKSNFVPYQWPMPDKFLYFVGELLDLSMLSLADRKSTNLGVKGGGADGSLSPDGRWLAYYSRETGRLEVTTFPASSTRITVAPNGVDTHWSRKGNALFYLNSRTGELMGVDVTPGDPPRFGSPRRIYAGPLDFFTVHSFDLTPNEDRFIVHTPDPGGDITVLLNWPSLLNAGGVQGK